MKCVNAAIAALICIISFSACEKDPPPAPVRQNLIDLTIEDQINVGQKLSNEIFNHPTKFPILDKVSYAPAYNYVNNIMEALLNTIECKNRNTFDWNLYIINDDETATAFNTPGGNIYIYSGLLKFLDAENQLACLLAHEIAYTDMGLIGERLVEEYGGEVMGDILLENAYDNQVEAVACSLIDIKFDYNTVFEADTYALKLVCPFQYEAHGLKNVLNKIDLMNEDLQWVNTRPSYSNRLDMIDLNAEGCGIGESTYETRYLDFKNNLLP